MNELIRKTARKIIIRLEGALTNFLEKSGFWRCCFIGDGAQIFYHDDTTEHDVNN